jgi:hypothetical protein
VPEADEAIDLLRLRGMPTWRRETRVGITKWLGALMPGQMPKSQLEILRKTFKIPLQQDYEFDRSGSTTTKARFFHRTGEEWRFLVAGESPTTVEAPYEDVTLGVRNAVREIEELTGHKILSSDGSGILVPYDGKRGVGLYCTTSSAGGCLQMMVAGVIKSMTAESANRAALGAGAIVMDIIAVDDGRPDYEKIKHIRSLRPDMILDRSAKKTTLWTKG